MTSKTLGEDTKKVLSSEAFRFVSFVVTGGISAACNLVARFWMSRVMRYEFAVLFAYLVGMIVAFVLAAVRVRSRWAGADAPRHARVRLS